MDRKKLATAVVEAERFIKLAGLLPDAVSYESCGHSLVRDNFPREQGAIRRASMDLTRSLADLRRNPYS